MSTHGNLDQFMMQRALTLAARTVALASPNPQVGCVLTRPRQGKPIVLGEGAHLYDRRDHAEIVALKDAAVRGHSTVGATAYVTLEPCSHHGRTGPCADALIRSGIIRCVVATQDPNPLVSGQGLARLRAAGVDVTLGVLQQQARDLNDPFAHYIQHHTPLVTLKAALSVDGKLAPPPADRFGNQPHWLTGPAARGDVQLLRHASDAILTGIGTVLADDPSLTDRTGLPRRRPLLRVVLDTHLRIPLTSKLVRSAGSARGSSSARGSNSDLLILCGLSAPTDRIDALEQAAAEVLPIPDHAGHLSLPAVLATLGERSLLSLLLETGSHLNGAFLNQHLADKAVLFYAETELGEHAIPFAQGVPSPFLLQQTLKRVTHTTLGPDAVITGYLTDPWSNTP
jgi:diaminohydroxyphosphoribosylaminopyrimidine deaminase/5-amino-6-(5-phosphoribosylamino)uracil reductase